MSLPSVTRRLLGGTAVLLGTAGCLGDPPIEERWTLLEIVEPPDLSAVAPGSTTPVTARARITYREILTGAVIAEMRASTSVSADELSFEDEENRLQMARDVDHLLRNSTSIGFDARAVTGFDREQLIWSSGYLAGLAQLSADAPAASATAARAPARSTVTPSRC